MSNSLDPDQARRNVTPLDEFIRYFNNNTPPTLFGCAGMSDTSQIACAEKHQSHLQSIKLFAVLYFMLDFSSKSAFLKMYTRDTTRVSNSLDPDQARRYVGPDLGPNYF